MRCALLRPRPHSGGQFDVDFCGRKAVSGFCAAVDAGVNDRAGDGPEADAHFGFARGIAAGCSEKFCRWVKGCGYMLRVFGRNEGATVRFRDAFECFLAYPGREVYRLLGSLVRAQSGGVNPVSKFGRIGTQDFAAFVRVRFGRDPEFEPLLGIRLLVVWSNPKESFVVLRRGEQFAVNGNLATLGKTQFHRKKSCKQASTAGY